MFSFCQASSFSVHPFFVQFLVNLGVIVCLPLFSNFTFFLHIVYIAGFVEF